MIYTMLQLYQGQERIFAGFQKHQLRVRELPPSEAHSLKSVRILVIAG